MHPAFLLALAMPARTLEVSAAASLKEAFTAMGRTFEASHPGVRVRLTFAGSQTLAAQIAQGAPADVFASAAPKNLAQVAYDPTTRRVFALNRLVIVTPKDRPTVVLSGLNRVPRLVLAAPAVPAGGYALQALNAASRKFGAAWLGQVRSRVVSSETDVRAVLAKVELGEADAGIVYASDAHGRSRVRATLIPAAYQPRIEYPVAVLQDAREPALARDFVALLGSPAGRRALNAQGFGVPVAK